MLLPTNITARKDQMSKRIVQDAKVLNYITEALISTEDDYFVGNCEWKDGTRSDLVLQPKSSSMDLPPIIVEIQHKVNKKFMRRDVGYCLLANLKFDVEPILLVVCVGTLNEEIKDDTVDSRLPGIHSYFCKPWAECFILCQDSLTQNLTTPLNPLIALGLFLSSRFTSIFDNPYGGDPTMQYLYALASHHHQIDSQDIVRLPMKLIDSQITEYDRLLTLANSSNQPQLVEAINEAKTRIYTIKRKYDDCFTAEDSSDKVVAGNDENDDLLDAETFEFAQDSSSRGKYEAAMNFVAKFKEESKRRQKNGLDCLS
ncbi:unnamed protein product [Rhizopus stolonifer]